MSGSSQGSGDSFVVGDNITFYGDHNVGKVIGDAESPPDSGGPPRYATEVVSVDDVLDAADDGS
jgi:hypothetical protein